MIQHLSKEWQRDLHESVSKEYFYKLCSFLEKERLKNTVFPPEKLVFQALNLCPANKTKVVILGQDPYHKPNQAHGLAFSVKGGVKRPPSLNNVFKELRQDLGVDKGLASSLEPWASQGVLLLNTCLTVSQNAPLSHAKIGWQNFTKAVLEVVALQKHPVVFLLWGNNAKKSCQFLKSRAFSRHLILEAGHPSPLSCRHFFGCKHFSKTNNFLLSIGKESIIW